MDLSNYATKSDFKNAAGVHTANFAKKVDLAGLISEIPKLYIDELKTTPIDLSNLSNVGKHEIVKKTVYGWWIG